MKRQVLALLIIGLAAGCSKKSKEEGTAGADPKAKEQRGLSGLSTTPGDTGTDPATVEANTPIKNSYAEKNWQLAGQDEDEWTQEFDAATTPEEQINVMGKKQSSGPEQLAGLIRRALRVPNERVRTEAAQMLTSFVTLPDEVPDLVVGAVHDPSSEVRILAMEAARELLPDTQVEVYKQTIAVPDEAVRQMTIKELGRMVSKPAFEVLMTGLQNPDPGFRQQVNFEIKLLVDQEFESYDQARNWWDGPGAVSYNDNMIHTGGNE